MIINSLVSTDTDTKTAFYTKKIIKYIPKLPMIGLANKKWFPNRLCCKGDSKFLRASKSHYWFNGYGNFAEWVDFACWWSFSGGGSAINGATRLA